MFELHSPDMVSLSPEMEHISFTTAGWDGEFLNASCT